MHRLTCLIIVIVLGGMHAAGGASSLREQVERGNELLEQGEAQAALELYQLLQIEAPSSGVLRYNMGSAKVSLGKEALEAGDLDEAFEHFEAAQEIFDSLPEDADIELRRDAAYNRANTEGRQARAIARARPYEEALEAVEDSISSYEEFLAQYPDHKAAQHNLDHMRYLRKTLLENPPQEEPDEDESEDEEPQEEGEEPEPENSGDEGEEGEKEEEGEGEEQPEAGDGEQEQDPEEREAPAGPQPNPEETESPETPENPQTLEAILEALEEEDNREQREMLREHDGPRIRAQWW